MVDNRKRRSIKMSVAAYLLIFAFAFRVSSFNDLKYWLEKNNKRFKNLFGKNRRLPKTDALRDLVKIMRTEDVKSIFDGVVDTAIENKAIRENTINGLRASALDGVEYFVSKKKSCADCLTREVGREKEYFHKAVVCMTVGNDPHVILGAETLKPKNDGSGKCEGEMTAAKRLLLDMRRTHHHFSDVIVADALYMNAPFINLVKGIGMDVVIRAKDARLNIVKDALGLFAGTAPSEVLRDTKKRVEVWDDNNFGMEGCPENIRFLRFVEHWKEKKRQKERRREMWCITTLQKPVTAHTVWLIMRRRWDIENNGFRMLKTYFHADHCYVHGEGANEKILLFIMIAFNLMELFMFRRLRAFDKQKMTRKHLTAQMWDELLTDKYAQYFETG